MSNRRAQDERIEGTPDGSNAITEIVDVPNAPTIGTATGVIGGASVPFTAATTGGTASLYTATSSPGSITGTSATSPITVSGLTGGTAYTFTVTPSNSTGTGPASSSSNSVTIPDLVNGYDALAVTTLSTNTSSVTFTGIPTGYDHLQVRMLTKDSGTGTGGPNIVAVINGDIVTTNYRSHYLGSDGTGTNVGTVQAAGYYCLIGNTATSNASYANMFGALVLDVLDYGNTSKNKTLRGLWGHDRNGTGETGIDSSVWMKTEAITSITFSIVGGSNFVTNSSFALYGVK
jgi:hypothetical protein